MARPLRIEYAGAWYHVLNRGRRREKIFFSPYDCKKFLELLGECSKLFGIEIHCYSLIPNHYHLLICTPKPNLSRSMRHLNGCYTQFINRKYKSEGSLFKGRFKSMLIDKDNYLLEAARYIHRNPFRAKLENRIGKHEWTSHRAYMNTGERPKWLTTDYILSEFGEYDKEAKRLFDAFVNREPPEELSKVLDSVKWPAILGGKEFKESVKARLKGKKIEKREMPQYNEMQESLTLGDLTKAAEKIFGEKAFLAIKKSKIYALKRRAIAYVIRQHLNIPWREACTALGDISYAAFSKQFLLADKEINAKTGCYEDYKKLAGRLKLYS